MPSDQTSNGVHLHKTRNNQNAKAVAIELLQARLADGIDVSLITKQAHWNLKGPQFIGVHLMLDTFRTEQDEFVDTMAERITQLGGTARGTVQEVDKKTTLEPYPVDIYAVSDHIHALIDRYAKFANAIRENIDEIDEAGDPDTADIFTEVSRGIDKQLWFLEAHTQEQSPSQSFPKS
ncbi:DNA starvation/stationary phase protection protein Dps [Acidisphaera sp. L21]|uniref:DNA starvation/stationary phase protection protein Dps n=1 Tax=Acidisphaera sp. L21 TaxID=1641851 RepID=UPI00131E0E59